MRVAKLYSLFLDFAYVNNVRLFTQFSHVGRLYSLATSK